MIKDMDEAIQTSTPIINGKIIPPPPRKLWATDSVTEQLYRNKWEKYRNLSTENDIWDNVEAPNFMDFEDIPSIKESYFDNVNEEKIVSPRRTEPQQLPGLEVENNNILESLEKCRLSAIEKNEQDKHDMPPPARSGIKNNAEKGRRPATMKFGKNVKFENRPCTVMQPFSFEFREKCKQENKQARRERDIFYKGKPKIFHATPLPNFLKPRVKAMSSPPKPSNEKKPGISDLPKKYNKSEIWKKKPFQPCHLKRAPLIPKPPDLLTAARAAERKRFEEYLRERERQRLASQKQEEAARKKMEQEEIAKLRKQLVHKAQPVPKFKTTVSKVEKRPLTEPTTPIVFKRRRKN